LTFVGLLAVGAGAAAGAWLRWGLGILLNPVFPTLPLGTFAANLLGGLLMGVAMALFAHFETMPAAVRLLVATGFLGGLTTFSTFSAETVNLLLREQFGWATVEVLAHLLGTILMTLSGLGLARLALR
jgi:fluoride exporter